MNDLSPDLKVIHSQSSFVCMHDRLHVLEAQRNPKESALEGNFKKNIEQKKKPNSGFIFRTACAVLSESTFITK